MTLVHTCCSRDVAFLQRSRWYLSENIIAIDEFVGLLCNLQLSIVRVVTTSSVVLIRWAFGCHRNMSSLHWNHWSGSSDLVWGSREPDSGFHEPLLFHSQKVPSLTETAPHQVPTASEAHWRDTAIHADVPAGLYLNVGIPASKGP